MKPSPVQCLLPKAPNTTNYHGKVVIFTAFYDYKGYAPYITSMIQQAIWLERLGIEWDYWHIYGDFHFDRALNQAMTNFMESDATDIILIDSDLKWSADAVLRLLTHDVDVVAGSYRMKNQWEQYTGIPARDEATGQVRGKILKDGTALVKADRVTGGFTRFRKSALQRFADAHPELHYADGQGQSVGFWHSAISDGLFHSHDYIQSKRWLEIGVDLWIDPNMDLTHYGTLGYPGNLDKFLRDDGKTAAAFETIKQMAAEVAQRPAA